MSAYYTPITHTSPEVLSLETAKKQLKMEDLGTYDDTLITECIEAAIDEAEQYTNINIRERKYTINFTTWQLDFEFFKQYLQSVDTLSYIDPDGPTQVLVVADYLELFAIDDYAQVIHFTDFDNLPTLKENINSAVTITVTVGYADGEVPKGILQAIKLLVTDNYDFRGDREVKNFTASRRKLEPYKYYQNPR